MDPSGTRAIVARPVKAGPQPEVSLAWSRGRPWLRSVDNECAGRVMEPRNSVVGADAVAVAEGNTDVLEREDAQGPGTKVPPGSESRACARGISRNLGGPVASSVADCGAPRVSGLPFGG